MMNKLLILTAVVLLFSAGFYLNCRGTGALESKEVAGYPKTADGADAQEAEETAESPSRTDDAELYESILPPAALADRDELILVREGYVTSYNTKLRIPNWVAWRLTADHTSGSHKRKSSSYREDDEVPFPKAQNSDYYNSGYDRGHMCPSGDNKWDAQAQDDCFLFTNICPQNHNLNGGDWNELEMRCRKWAQRYGEVFIVCGPVLYNQKHKTIGRNKVVVPEAFFKVVLCMTGTPRAIGFIYRNSEGDRPMGDYINSVDQVERITGIDFFPALPDDVEDRVEAEANLREW